ncbi:MAG: SPOR domain-containing protein [Acidobacteriota bacterium]
MWIGAGSVALAFLVAAASWLFTPRPSSDPPGPAKPVPESVVERKSFVQESAETDSEDRVASSEGPSDPEEPLPFNPERRPEDAASAPAPVLEPPPSSPPLEDGRTEKPANAVGVAVQLGAFGTPANARELAGRLKAMGYGARVVSKDGRHKVLIPGFPDRASAEKALQDLKRAGFSGAFVVSAE